MMEFFKILAWLLLNVAVPLLAPIALLPLLGASKTYHDSVRTLVRRSLQEGQLFWTVIAMCAAACYEAAGHVPKPVSDQCRPLHRPRPRTWQSPSRIAGLPEAISAPASARCRGRFYSRLKAAAML